jgi:hypothetical protein
MQLETGAMWAAWVGKHGLPLSLNRDARPRRTKLKGNPMTGANAIVSRPPVAVASREKPI